ncbi:MULTISPECIES: fumarylacetoacetate hydrolase family protein [Corynebacterium]|uniref:fumarylacetoacetate hydrolase family protein n=1 Tax=Corynebacterium TaxID=1716 RepID=UPI00019C1F04|nr:MULTISPECIES: fumarylacetoacetate hydrolase family protein [Corynebacterium]EEI26257.1 FAH family protein [Corynebacterium glucuronolyticum ATCC 51867]MCT1443506.1 fumarylacetoacetate hydrolase family protein [Corynebacterium glucuronolyticum]MCT1564042.1 fumarylacetoacetate hydrolase family protein [Corynebacterium glucuronolyticum]OFO46991.1 2-hydroxyhepta-2,4-diene-1,7-dioate isomerase [Corynebacterium sp. HMSC073D01]QRO82295.1 fumarylacetoacetate hydrolase family protein [Corynebacteriu
MRYARIATPEAMTFAVVEGDGEDIKFKAISNHPFEAPEYTGKEYGPDEVRLLAPMLPSKILLIGRNYADHVQEVFNQSASTLPPTLFMKPPTSIIGPGAAIKIPDFAQKVEFEGEIALVISKPCKNVKKENWRDVVLGLTIVNDVSDRNLQFAEGQWTRGKGIDTFCPMGPWIDTDLDAYNLADTKIKGHLTHDGETTTWQDSSTNQMIWDFGEIIEYISGSITLLPGDVISTGSPAGTKRMLPGDTIAIEVEGLGTLRNTVTEA